MTKKAEREKALQKYAEANAMQKHALESLVRAKLPHEISSDQIITRITLEQLGQHLPDVFTEFELEKKRKEKEQKEIKTTPFQQPENNFATDQKNYALAWTIAIFHIGIINERHWVTAKELQRFRSLSEAEHKAILKLAEVKLAAQIEPNQDTINLLRETQQKTYDLIPQNKRKLIQPAIIRIIKFARDNPNG